MILVTGANGQLGHCFRQIAAAGQGPAFVFVDIAELDITKPKEVRAFFKKHQPGWCINCAAYTAVDRAETEPLAAKRINVNGVRNLALACAESGIPLIHLSSDYVYHTSQNTPFKENDPVRPQSVYARTKLGGDRAALKNNPLSMVIRSSWIYAPWGNNFVRTMVRLGRERSELKVVFDQIGTPTYAPDLANAIMQIIQSVESGNVKPEDLQGVWHYSNEGVASWYDFALAIMAGKQIKCRVLPIETKDFPTPAKRPPFSVLNKGKIKDIFGLSIPHWQESLERCLQQVD